jgi:site-specific recombinase XerC
MAKNLPFDCFYSDIWVHPENWKSLTTQKSLKLNWYIECKFHDPNFKDKYPKGFPFRKKVNSLRTLEERKAAIQLYLKEIPKLLEVRGYNPITKKYMIPEAKPVPGHLHPKVNFIEALKLAYPLLSVGDGVKKELRRIIAKIEKMANSLYLDFPICEIHSGYIRDLLDPLNLTANEYNKFLTHLSIVLSDLCEKRVVLHNPIRDIKKKKTVKKIRETFEITELNQIFEYLKINHYNFYRYGMVFFHSGSRSTELFRLQRSKVFLEKQEYRLTILKGNHYKEVNKVILQNAFHLWQELIDNCKNENYYLFGKNLEPSETPIQAYQITKRFKRLIKDKMVFKDGILIDKIELESNDIDFKSITADFYSLKHLFLDEIDRITNELSFQNLNFAKGMASHTTGITESVYLTGRGNRNNEVLKNMKIEIIK